MLSGALAGLAGVVEVLGPNGRLVSGFLPTHGFTAILIALVAGLSIVGTAVVSLFFGGLAAAGLYLPVLVGLPAAAIDIINAAIALFITARAGLDSAGFSAPATRHARRVMDEFLVATLRYGTPLVYVTMAGVLAQRAGVWHLGLEGLMIIGCCASVLGVVQTGSLLVGLGLAIVLCVIASALLWFVIEKLRANPIIAGLGLTGLGLGGTDLAVQSIYGSQASVNAPYGLPRLGPAFGAFGVLSVLVGGDAVRGLRAMWVCLAAHPLRPAARRVRRASFRGAQRRRQSVAHAAGRALPGRRSVRPRRRRAGARQPADLRLWHDRRARLHGVSPR